MRHDTDMALRALIWGVFSLALGATCLMVAASSDAQPISLHELASGGSSVLMSCADDASPGSEPMWCSNPDSPHCLPALPKPAAPDVTQGPVATLFVALVAPAIRHEYDLRPAWSAPHTKHVRSLQLSHRLERPPRSV